MIDETDVTSDQDWQIGMNMTARQKMERQWRAFKDAFLNLGEESKGMTPAAASLLAVTAVEYEVDHSNGFQPLQAGAPLYAMRTEDGGPIVSIPKDYLGCAEFWAVDTNNLRAQITPCGHAYVLKNIDVFKLLNGL